MVKTFDSDFHTINLQMVLGRDVVLLWRDKIALKTGNVKLNVWSFDIVLFCFMVEISW